MTDRKACAISFMALLVFSLAFALMLASAFAVPAEAAVTTYYARGESCNTTFSTAQKVRLITGGSNCTNKEDRLRISINGGPADVLTMYRETAYTENTQVTGQGTGSDFAVKDRDGGQGDSTVYLDLLECTDSACTSFNVLGTQTYTLLDGGTGVYNDISGLAGTVASGNRLGFRIRVQTGGNIEIETKWGFQGGGSTREIWLAVDETPAGDTLTADQNTAIEASNPGQGQTGIVMQRIRVTSDNGDDGQVTMTTVTVDDVGTADADDISNLKIYISDDTAFDDTPTDTLLATVSGWDGTSTVVDITDTVVTTTSRYLFIVYDLDSAATVDNTIRSEVNAIAVSSPDTGASGLGFQSNLLTIQACTENASVAVDEPVPDPITGSTSISATLSGGGTPGSEEVSDDNSTWHASPWTYTPPADSTGTVTFYARATGDCGTVEDPTPVTTNYDTTCTETASVYLSQVGPTAGFIQEPITGSVSVVATLDGTGGSSANVSTDGSTWNASPYTYSPPASSTGAVTFFVNAAGVCGEITGAYNPTSIDYDTTAANVYTVTACNDCHYYGPTDSDIRNSPEGAVVGSHFSHKRVGLACTACHIDNGNAGSSYPQGLEHREGLIEMAQNGTSYSGGTSFAQVDNPTLGTCANLNCHGSSTPIWGDNALRAKGVCATCHGMSDPGKTGRDTSGATDPADAQVGAHATHLNSSNNYTLDIACANCHAEPSGVSYAAKVFEGTGHNDTALPAELTWGSIAVTNGSSPSWSGTQCSSTWCHGAQLGNGDQAPAWTDTALLAGGGGADCEACHDHPEIGAENDIQAHQSAAYSASLSSNGCKSCHLDMNNSAAYDTFDSVASHVDGVIDNVTCVTCHEDAQPSTGSNRRAVTGASGDIGTTSTEGLSSHHIQPDAGGVQDDSCVVCHYQDLPKLTDGTNVRLYDPDTGAVITYDGTGSSIETFCDSCHDGDGATRSDVTDLDPFDASGDLTDPPATGWNTNSTHKANLTDKCMGCHGKQGAANDTLDPDINAHGSASPKITRWTYDDATPDASGFCYSCHGNTLGTRAQGATDNIQEVYGLASDHATNDEHCLDCHDQHRAEAGRHTVETTGLAPVNYGVMVVNSASVAWPSAWSSADFTGLADKRGASGDDEWQLCLKCHSGGAAGSVNAMALEFNPNNASYHPVVQQNPNRNQETPGNNNGQGGPVFTGVWDVNSLMTCSDCHTNSDAAKAQGPHGSANDFVLVAPYTSATGYGEQDTDLCFRCHLAEAYGADSSVLSTNDCGKQTCNYHTGFSDDGINNSKEENLHVYHVAKRGYECQACHLRRIHGATNRSGESWDRGLLLWDGDATPSPYRQTGVSPADWLYISTWQTSPGNWNQNDCSINTSTGGH